jgi:hypothetical protein
MSNFGTQTSAFFDELGNILTEYQRDKEQGMDQKNDRPFSSLLTQDEEPIGDGTPASLVMEEPEVVTRGAS